MPIPAWRAKQSTSTSGTGTLTLNAAGAAFRSFAAAFGASSIKVLYTISSASYFEQGIGTFNGGSPGTLTRDAVLASSNAGALVSLPAGVSDVFATFLPSQAEVVSFSATSTAQLADLGCIFHFTGTSAATLNLPAIATVPPNAGFIVRNSAALTSAGILTIDPNASEQVNGASTILLFPGESVQLYAVGGAWFATGLGNGWRTIRQQTASNVAQLDFTLPSGMTAFRVDCENVRPITDNSVFYLRTSTDGGSTFAAGATDYSRTWEATTPATTNVASVNNAGTGATLIDDLDNTTTPHAASGEVFITPGDGSRYPMIRALMGYYGDATTSWRMQRSIAVRVSTTAVNAIRFLMSGGNIANGNFTLHGRA